MSDSISRSVRDRWERRLARAGLKPLDWVHQDTIEVGNRGSGKIYTDADAAKRAAREVEIERRRDILRTFRFGSRLDRQIWTLYADGLGTPAIASTVNIGRQRVRFAINQINLGNQRKVSNQCHENIPQLIKRTDPAVLQSLLHALLQSTR